MEAAASKAHVVCPSGSSRVVAFYALSMGQIPDREATGPIRRNMPRFVPAVMLGRLAVDRDFQGRGLGGASLHAAVSRSLRAGTDVAAALILVHAISPAAEAFCSHYGFVRRPVETPTCALDLVGLAREFTASAPRD